MWGETVMAANLGRLLILSLVLAPWLNAQEQPVAFVDVNVVPMDKEQIVPHQTVVAAGGRITQIVATGRRADLLLLDANPLEDVKNASKRAGVMVRGHWLTEAELQRRLVDLLNSYQRRRGSRGVLGQQQVRSLPCLGITLLAKYAATQGRKC